ncbi:class I adenylate-forming enzyme family protein [Oceanobacillus longus]|uniref:Class I adenylate-forming enzyme family protein n=1 Tax=Oceanobacillus longus TaxID=930120 RepID=A0ABV8H135_9BACI
MSATIKKEKITLFGRENISVYANRPTNLNEMLQKTVDQYPNKTAFIMEDEELTYTEANDRATRLAATLQQEYGLAKGDRIISLIGNDLAFPIVTFACFKLGAIMVPVNTKLTASEISYIVEHSKPKLIIHEDAYQAVINESIQRFPEIEPYTQTTVSTGGAASGVTLESLINQNNELKAIPIEETDAAFILYTSGTTGRPKGAVISHINVLHSVMHYKNTLQTDSEIRTIIAVPFFHVTGLVGQFLHMVYIGGSSAVLRRYQNEDYIRTSHKLKVNCHINAPTLFIMMATSPIINDYSFDFVRIVGYGGSAIYQQTIEKMQEIFPNATYRNVYGATETTSPTTMMPASYPMSKVASVGFPVENGQVKVADREGNELGTNEPGELLIKGPMVIGEYWDNEEANKKSFIDGYWKSGDIAKIDDDGFIYILDRMKDMINRGGEKIFSIEVEDVLKKHPEIIESAVISIPDETYGERVKAVIVSDSLKQGDESTIQTFCLKHLAKFKVPEVIEFIPELPKTASGKILKNQLRVEKKKKD